jgi:hypothetical protein
VLTELVPGIQIPQPGHICNRCNIHANNFRQEKLQPLVKLKKGSILSQITQGIRKKSRRFFIFHSLSGVIAVHFFMHIFHSCSVLLRITAIKHLYSLTTNNLTILTILADNNLFTANN